MRDEEQATLLGGDEEAGISEESRSRRGWIVGTLVAAPAIFTAVWFVTQNGDAATTAESESSLSFSEVIVRDLEQIKELAGTLGFDLGDPISSRFSGTLTGSVEPGDVVDHGDILFSVDEQPVVLLTGDSPSYRDLAIGDVSTPVLGRLSGPITEIVDPGTIVEEGDVLYRADEEPVVVLYGDTLAYRTLRDASTNLTGTDVFQLEAALVDMGYDPDGTVTVDDEFTYSTRLMVEAWQEDIGATADGVITLGQVVFLPGPALVVDASLPGDVASPSVSVAVLLSGDPLSGTDVEQLEVALSEAGFSPGPTDGVFSVETQQAVIEWQESKGMRTDGVVNLGEVVFLPGAVRVAAVNLTLGASINPGTALISTSSNESVVTVNLDARDQGLLAEGDQVIVVLPNDVEASATVSYVAALANNTGAGQDRQTTFEILIELDDGSAAAGFDEAPVEVKVITDQRLSALAVPVGSLLALAEGGYAVEVDRGNEQTELIAVDPGMYADGYVEIKGADGLQAGDRVVMAR